MKNQPISFSVDNATAARLFRAATEQYFATLIATKQEIPKDHINNIMYEFCRIILSPPFFATVKMVQELTGLSREATYNVIKRHKEDTRLEYIRSCNLIFKSRRK